MKNIYRVITVAGLTLISILFLMTYTVLAKELPILVDITELSEMHEGRACFEPGPHVFRLFGETKSPDLDCKPT